MAEASEHARGEQEVSLLKNIFTTIAASVCSILEVSAQINTQLPVRNLDPRRTCYIQGWAKEWTLGCVNPAS